MRAIRTICACAALLACGGGSGGEHMTSPDASGSDGGSNSPGGTLWIVGQNTAFRFDGSAWHPEAQGLPLTGSTGSVFTHVYDVWVPSSTEAWGIAKVSTAASIDSAVLKWKDGAWSEVKSFPEINLYSIWGTGINDIWVGGDDAKGASARPQLFHWDGTAWTPMLNTEVYTVAAIWGRSPTEVYFGLRNNILRYDGISLRRDYHMDNVGCSSFFGTTPINIWTTCYDLSDDEPRLMQRNGPNSWSTTSLSTNLTSFAGLHGSSASDIWMVGNVSERPGVLRSTGAGWTPVPLPDTLVTPLRGVWAAPGEVWVVGDAGKVLRYDGASWQTIPIGTSEQLRAIRGKE
jgi:hypothetical protein